MYPSNSQQLVGYLKQYPIVNVKYPTKKSVYTFQNCDGFRIWFVTPVYDDIVIPVSQIQYNADGFTRTVGNLVGWFYYTGPKLWQQPKSKSVEDWDSVLEGLKQFIKDQ